MCRGEASGAKERIGQQGELGEQHSWEVWPGPELKRRDGSWSLPVGSALVSKLKFLQLLSVYTWLAHRHVQHDSSLRGRPFKFRSWAVGVPLLLCSAV